MSKFEKEYAVYMERFNRKHDDIVSGKITGPAATNLALNECISELLKLVIFCREFCVATHEIDVIEIFKRIHDAESMYKNEISRLMLANSQKKINA